MMTRKTTPLFLFIAFCLILTACKKDIAENGDDVSVLDKNVIVNNDKQSISSRMTKLNEQLTVEDVYSAMKSSSPATKPDLTKNYAFKLMAEVAPPVLNGNTLQATHVRIIDHYAFVTYNTKGSKYFGGIDIFDVKDIRNPSIIGSYYLSNMDVSSIDYYDSKLYIVGAYDIDVDAPKHLQSPAMLEVLSLDADKKIISVDTIVDLSAYTGTDVRVDGQAVYTTAGSNGGLKVFDHSYKLLKNVQLDNARALDLFKEKVYVLQGQPGRVTIYNKADVSLASDYNVGDANQAEAKSGIVASDDYIFAALNEGGVQMLNQDGSLKQLVPRPSIPAGGVSDNFVSNSVSLQNDLVLIANGEAGLYVGNVVSEQNDTLVVMGKIKFKDNASTNFVTAKDSVVFVATGLGGLKILSYTINNGLPPYIVPTEPCASLVSDFYSLFPAGSNNKNKYPQLFESTSLKELVLTKESEVWLTFIDENAYFKNTLGYYTYTAGNPPAKAEDLKIKNLVGESVVFPNASKTGGGGGLKYGDRVQVGKGKFPAGTVIGFYLKQNGFKNGVLTDNVITFYTTPALNSGAQQHTLFKAKKCGNIVINFEDFPMSSPWVDNDFNDILFTISDSSDPNKVTDSFDLTNIQVLPQ